MTDAAAWMAPGRSRVSTFIVVPEAMRVAQFAEDVFGARRVRPPLLHGDGRLWNLEMTVGDSTIMLGDATAGMMRAGFLYVHVPDARETFDGAVAAGARPISEPARRFYDDLHVGVEEMAGNLRWIATHVEDVGTEEMAHRAAAEEGGT